MSRPGDNNNNCNPFSKQFSVTWKFQARLLLKVYFFLKKKLKGFSFLKANIYTKNRVIIGYRNLAGGKKKPRARAKKKNVFVQT